MNIFALFSDDDRYIIHFWALFLTNQPSSFWRTTNCSKEWNIPSDLSVRNIFHSKVCTRSPCLQLHHSGQFLANVWHQSGLQQACLLQPYKNVCICGLKMKGSPPNKIHAFRRQLPGLHPGPIIFTTGEYVSCGRSFPSLHDFGELHCLLVSFMWGKESK